MEAPLAKIKSIIHDINLILEFKEEDVKIYRSISLKGKLIPDSTTDLFYLGAPLQEDIRHKEKLQKLLNAVLIFYLDKK